MSRLGAVVEELRAHGVKAETDVPLGERTTHRVGGRADVGVWITDVASAVTVSRVIAGLDFVVVGQGSNTLVADAGFRGVAVFVGDETSRVMAEEALTVVEDGGSDQAAVAVVRASGSVRLPVLARRTVALGWCGLEWMVGVPGSVGGAVCMNAGGHGSDVADSLVAAEIIDLRSGRRAEVAAPDLGLRFRGSALAQHHLVLSALFSVRRPIEHHQGTCSDVLAEVVAWRREHQPGGQNAGSVFVNPAPDDGSAGNLIDACGLRGRRLATAEVSVKHANFIQVDPGGCADDVLALMCLVQDEVHRRFGMVLRSEIRLVGFEPEIAGRFAVVEHYGLDDETLAASTARLDALL